MTRRTPWMMFALLLVMAVLAAACGGPASDEGAAEAPAGDAGGTDASGTGEGEAGQPAGEGMEDGIVVRMDGESREDYLARLYEAAQQEGQVAYYTSSGEDENETVRNSWMAQYPDIELEPVSATSGTILERALLEIESGNVQADVYNGSSADAVVLEPAGGLAEYRPANEEDLDEEFVMDGPYVAIGYLSFHPAYNTTLVEESELPDEWMGYCEEQWRGQIAIDQEAFEWVAGLLSGMGEEEGMAFLECLAENEPRLVRGSTNRTELLAAGEFKVMLDGYGHRLWEFEQEGAPIKVQVPSPEPMVMVPELMMLMDEAPHPNAGRLLMEFFLTPEGQEVFAQQNKAGTVTVGEQGHPYAEYMEGTENPAILGPNDADFDAAFQRFGELFLEGGGGAPAP